MFLSRILSEERSASYSRFPEIIGTHSVFFREEIQDWVYFIGSEYN